MTAANVAQFNPALGTLTGVSINLTGTAVVGSAQVTNLEAYSTSASVFLAGTHHTTTINGFDIANPANATSGTTAIGPNPASANVGPVNTAIGGGGATSTTGWTGVGTVGILVNFVGGFGVSTDPQAKVTSDPTLTSSGVGTVTYTYQESNVPEAETYVAGLAMLGLVGYGFYRRSRKA